MNDVHFGAIITRPLDDHPSACVIAIAGVVEMCVRRVPAQAGGIAGGIKQRPVTYHAHYSVCGQVFHPFPSRCWLTAQEAADWAAREARETLRATLQFAGAL